MAILKEYRGMYPRIGRNVYLADDAVLMMTALGCWGGRPEYERDRTADLGQHCVRVGMGVALRV